MCLGIPAQLIAFDEAHPHLATADVHGSTYQINVALLVDEPPQPGEWVLLHMGFAMERLSAEEAARALEGLAIAGAGEPAPEAGSYPAAAAPAMRPNTEPDVRPVPPG